MKKYISIFFALILFISCSKDDEPISQTFFVNAYYTYSDYANYGNKIASPSMVMLYQDNDKVIDSTKINSFDPKLYDINGTELSLKYTSTTTTGINTFENIPNGKYVVLVIYYPYTYVRYYSFKKITVNYNYRASTEKILFDCSKNSGYQSWKANN